MQPLSRVFLFFLVSSLCNMACERSRLIGPSFNDQETATDIPEPDKPDPAEPVEPELPAETFQLVNASIDESSATFSSFRYRERFPDYSSGQASILSSIPQTYGIDPDGIEVFVEVHEDHLVEMGGSFRIRASQQIWSNLQYYSVDNQAIEKVCVLIQPKNTDIASAGLHSIELLKKEIHTFLDGENDCSTIASLPPESVISGIAFPQFQVPAMELVQATTQNDFKTDKRKRVGVHTVFSLSRPQ